MKAAATRRGTNGKEKAMTQTNDFYTFTGRSWEAFTDELEDMMLIVTGEELIPDYLGDIAGAFVAGLSPLDTVRVLLDNNPDLRQRAV
jgi:hypothetical protein